MSPKHEGLLDREALAAVEHGMLQDMENARGVFRQGLEGDAEQLVLLGAAAPAQLRAGLPVGHFDERGMDLLQLPHPGHGESVELISCLELHSGLLYRLLG